MKLDRRKAQAALLDAIRARSASFEVVQVMDLLDLLREDVKDRLISCEPDAFPRLQGEAQAYDNLIRMFTRPKAADLKVRSE